MPNLTKLSINKLNIFIHNMNFILSMRYNFVCTLYFLFDRGFQLNPNMKRFEIISFVPDIISIATVEANVKLFLIDTPIYGLTDTRISMLCNKAIIFKVTKETYVVTLTKN